MKVEVNLKDLIFVVILTAAILFVGLRLAKIEAALNSAALAQQVQKNTETISQVVAYLTKQAGISPAAPAESPAIKK